MEKTLFSFFALLLIISCEKEQIVTVDSEAEVVLAFRSSTANPDAKLWPPDYTYQTFTVEDMKPGLADDYSGDLNAATIEILSAGSDEAEDAPGTQDGNTLNDIVVAADCQSLQLRKEKMGGGNGRVYRVRVSITGDAGTQQADYIVAVPKWAWGWNSDAVDDGPFYLVSLDGDGDGYSCSDCDDTNAAVYPGATELCDGVDNNCDGDIDEGIQITYYIDADMDGYGDAGGSSLTACIQPDGYVDNSDDCNDSDPTINPGATEICSNGIDDDCDGDIYEADSDCTPLEIMIDPDGTPGNEDDYILYVQPSDDSVEIPWGDPDIHINEAEISYWDSAQNTSKIIAAIGDWNGGNYAAKLCADLAEATGLGWYLPAMGELHEMYAQLGPPQSQFNGSGDIIFGHYWSSNVYFYVPFGYQSARLHDFSNYNDIELIGNKDYSGRCRCVRK